MRRILITSFLLAAFYSNAQQSLTLEDCYALANKNYPMAKQIGLLQQKSDYEVDEIALLLAGALTNPFAQTEGDEGLAEHEGRQEEQGRDQGNGQAHHSHRQQQHGDE